MALNINQTKIEITAADKTSGAFDSVTSKIKNLTGISSTLAATLGVGFGVGAFAALVKGTIDAADGMNDLSKRTGISVERIGAWKLATEQSGTSIDALAIALGKTGKYMVEHGDNLKKLGIQGKTAEEVMFKLAGVISSLPADDPRRVALAMEVLGKSAGELLPLLSEGEAGLRKMVARGLELNPVNKELAENADKFNDALAEMKLISSGLFVELVGNTLPSFNQYLTELKAVISDGNWLDKLKFFTVGYVSENIANKTNDPVERIKVYTEALEDLRKKLDFTKKGFGSGDTGGIESQIKDYQSKLEEQVKRRNKADPNGLTTPAYSSPQDQLALQKMIDGVLVTDKPIKDNIGDKIRELEIVNRLLKQGVDLEDARTIAQYKQAGASDVQIRKILNLNNEQKQYTEAEKLAEKAKQDLVKATKDHDEAMQKLTQTSVDAVIQAQKEFAESERALQVMQYGESAVLNMESARLRESIATYEQGLAYAKLNGLSEENTIFMEGQILRLKELAEARSKLANSQDATTAFEKEKKRIEDGQKAQEDAIKKTAEEAQRAADSINQSITDALLRGFESGKGFAKNFRDTLINLFKTLVLQPVIKFLVDSSGISAVLGALSAAFSGQAVAGGGTGSASQSLVASGQNIFKLISNGKDSIVRGIESVGTYLTEGFGDLGSQIGGFIGENASAIADGFGYFSAALALSQGKYATAIGTAIGTYFAGPIGAAIGGFIGSFVDSLFGKHEVRPKYYANSIVSSTGTKLVNSYGNSDAKGDGGGVAIKAAKGFGDALNAYTKAFGGTLSAMKLGLVYMDKYKAFWVTVGKDIGKSGSNYDVHFKANESPAGVAQTFLTAVKKGFIDLPGYLENVVKRSTLKLKTALTDIDSLSALMQMQTALKDLPPVFNSISEAIKNTVTLATAGDLQKRFAAIGTYTSLFYSAQENFDSFTKQLGTQFTAFDAALPGTRDGFRSLVDSLANDLSEAGRKQFNGLVALAPAADAYYKQLEQQKASLESSAESLRDINNFTSLAEYRAFKGIANNYDTQFAGDFIASTRSGGLGNASNGKTTVDNVVSNEAVSLLRELRDYMKQNLKVSSDNESALTRMATVGIKTVAA